MEGSVVIATQAEDGTTARLVAALEDRIELLSDRALHAMQDEIPAYAAQRDPSFYASVRDHTLQHFRAALESFSSQHSVTPEDLPFIPHHTARRVRYVSLADFLHAFRVGQLVLWEGVLELAVDDSYRKAALNLVTHIVHYVNVASTQAAEAYIEARRLSSAEEERVRADLLEELLAGQLPTPGRRLNAARAAGLETDRPCLAIAVSARGCSEAPQAAVSAIVRALARPIRPLTVVRGEEVVIVASADEEPSPMTDRLKQVSDRLARHGVLVMIGVSTIQEGLGGVCNAYREACAAKERAASNGGVIALATMSAFEYLTDSNDPTAHRLVRGGIRDFVEKDAQQGGTLVETLQAYVAANLNATLAAQQLYVHVNTARYRLARIEAETGCNLRRVYDVVELLVAVRLFCSQRRAGSSNTC
jgi:sugar diacid utilization regulator